MVEYHIPVAPGGVAEIFHQLESNKSSLQIKHFSVSQTTLDEVSTGGEPEMTGVQEETSSSSSQASQKCFLIHLISPPPSQY